MLGRWGLSQTDRDVVGDIYLLAVGLRVAGRFIVCVFVTARLINLGIVKLRNDLMHESSLLIHTPLVTFACLSFNSKEFQSDF